MKPALTPEKLRAIFEYDPRTGAFTRKVAAGGVPVGAGFGHLDRDGYLCGMVAQKTYFLHRLAWFYVHGVWPEHEIDHVNGVKTDNRIGNLRDVDRRTNAENVRAPRGHNKSGWQGVSYRDGRFNGRIRVAGRLIHLGCFGTGEAAHLAYIEAKRTLHAGNTI